MALTLSLAAAANLASYAIVRYGKNKKEIFEKIQYKIAWSKYEENIKKMETYLCENLIFLNKSLNFEKKVKGLEIIDAYYGLDEHI